MNASFHTVVKTKNPEDPESKPAPVEYVRIEIPDGSIVDREATDADRHKYKTEYAAFRAPATPNESAAPIAASPTQSSSGEEPKKHKSFFQRNRR